MSILIFALVTVANTWHAGALNVGSLPTTIKKDVQTKPVVATPWIADVAKYNKTNPDLKSWELTNLFPMVRNVMLQNGALDHVTSFNEFPGHPVSFMNIVYSKGVHDGKGVNEKDLKDLTDDFETIWGETDVFPRHSEALPEDGDEGLNFFRAAKTADWIILLVVCIVLMLFDALVLRRVPDTFKWHLATVFLWIGIAAAFNFCIWGRMQYHKAFEWCSGYFLEWMLSMDNLFVFHLIFHAYKTPENQIHKAVFVGIAGALLMRMVFFMLVSTLLHMFSWFRWPFGVLLVWSGIQAARGDDDDDGAEQDSKLIRALKYVLGDRILDTYSPDGACFVTDANGKLQITMLSIVIVCLEVTDILFALDSVSAKVAQIPDQYIAFSSSVLAMFGLRALFFIVKDLVNMFSMLQYGLCIILVFIGIELIFSKMIHLASSTVCIMILAVFVISILGSTVRNRMLANRNAENKDEIHPELIKPH